MESFEENKENIRIYLLKIQTERKKTKLFGPQSRKAFRYLITERITYIPEATYAENKECDLCGAAGKKPSLICCLIRMYCREINLRIISFAIYFWLIFPQAWIYAFHQSSTLERNGVNFNTSAIFACKIFKIVSAEAVGSSGGHLFKETCNNGSLAIKIKMEITFWMQEANEYCIYNTLAFSMYEPLLNSCILEILKPGCLLKNADSSFSFYANVKRWRRIPVCWNKWISMWMGHIGLLPLETAAFKVQSRIKISYCDFSLFRSPNHVTFSALIGFEPVPHWLEVLSFLLIAMIYKSCNQWNNCFLSPFLILLLDLIFSFQDWWLWKHLHTHS